ncbi:MAG: glycosyltransferase family 87 protein [Candidatus Dormiibacterota bacterium]
MGPAPMNWLRGRLLIVACGGLLLNFVVTSVRALSYLSQSDFVPYDAAGRIIRAGGQCLYCIATQEASVHVVAGTANSGGLDTIGGLVFISPPAVAWLFAPLAGLDPHLGRVIFMVLSTAGLGLAAWLIATHWLPGLAKGQRICLVIASIAPVPAVIGVAGQIDPLIFTAVVLGITLARRFPVLGGVLIGALVLKPQLFVLVPVALIVSRQWRVLAGTALSTALVATSMFAQGLSHVLDWPRFVAAYGSLSDWLPQSLPPQLGFLTGSRLVLASAALLGYTLGSVCLWRCRRRLGSVQSAIGMGLVLTMIASPHLFGADLVMLVIPLVVVAARDWSRAISLALAVSVAGVLDVDLGVAIAGPLVLLAIALVTVAPGLVERRTGQTVALEVVGHAYSQRIQRPRLTTDGARTARAGGHTSAANEECVITGRI